MIYIWEGTVIVMVTHHLGYACFLTAGIQHLYSKPRLTSEKTYSLIKTPVIRLIKKWYFIKSLKASAVTDRIKHLSNDSPFFWNWHDQLWKRCSLISLPAMLRWLSHQADCWLENQSHPLPWEGHQRRLRDSIVQGRTYYEYWHCDEWN